MRVASTRSLYLILLVIATAPLEGQQFGQWWWDAVIGGTGRSFENRVGDRQVSSFDQTDLRLGLGLNGFIIHPSVARFRLGLDLLVSNIDGGQQIDTNRSGARLDLGLFERGPYPATFFYRRQLYDYSGLTADDALRLLGVPDTTTTLGGRVRIRRGPLTGLLVGFEHEALDFLLDRNGNEVQDRQFADWTAAGRHLKHHVRFERRNRDYGRVDLSFDDQTLNWDEHGTLGTDWRLDLSAVAVRRKVRVERADTVGIDTTRLFGQGTRTLAGGDLLTLSYNGGLSRADGSPSSDSHTVGIRYLWRRWSRWQINTFGDLSVQRGGTGSLLAPQVGASATWSDTLRGFDLAITGGGSYRLLDRQGTKGNDTALGLLLLANIARGEERTLRTELEVEVSRSELRRAGDTLDDLPDLGSSLNGVGTQDRYRARLSFSRRWRGIAAHAYTDWTRRSASDALLVDDFSATTLVHSLQLTARRLSLLATLGSTRVTAGTSSDQSVRFQSLSASYRPWRPLSLRGSWRSDQRTVSLGPNLDGDRIEAGFDLRIGALTLSGSVFETDERFHGAANRNNQGFRWTVTRRIAGLLPIVSAPRRRGRILDGMAQKPAAPETP